MDMREDISALLELREFSEETCTMLKDVLATAKSSKVASKNYAECLLPEAYDCGDLLNDSLHYVNPTADIESNSGMTGNLLNSHSPPFSNFTQECKEAPCNPGTVSTKSAPIRLSGQYARQAFSEIVGSKVGQNSKVIIETSIPGLSFEVETEHEETTEGVSTCDDVDTNANVNSLTLVGNSNADCACGKGLLNNITNGMVHGKQRCAYFWKFDDSFQNQVG